MSWSTFSSRMSWVSVLSMLFASSSKLGVNSARADCQRKLSRQADKEFLELSAAWALRSADLIAGCRVAGWAHLPSPETRQIAAVPSIAAPLGTPPIRLACRSVHGSTRTSVR